MITIDRNDTIFSLSNLLLMLTTVFGCFKFDYRCFQRRLNKRLSASFLNQNKSEVKLIPTSDILKFLNYKQLVYISRVNKDLHSQLCKFMSDRKLHLQSISFSKPSMGLVSKLGSNQNLFLTMGSKGADFDFSNTKDGVCLRFNEYIEVADFGMGYSHGLIQYKIKNKQSLLEYQKSKSSFSKIKLPDGFELIKSYIKFNHNVVVGKNKKGQLEIHQRGMDVFKDLDLSRMINMTDFEKGPIPSEFTLHDIAIGFHYIIMHGHNNEGNVMVYVSGRNYHGQLGLGHKESCSMLTPLTLPKGFYLQEVKTGFAYTCLIGVDDANKKKIYMCGSNIMGQLGQKDDHDSHLVLIDFPKDFSIKKVWLDDYSTFIFGHDENDQKVVYVAGDNAHGRLGVQLDQKKVRVFTKINLPCVSEINHVIPLVNRVIILAKLHNQEVEFTLGSLKMNNPSINKFLSNYDEFNQVSLEL